MPKGRSKIIDPKLLYANLASQSPEKWSTKLGAGGAARGTQYNYKITDRNFSAGNQWSVLIQAPSKRYAASGVVVRLDKEGCPARAAVTKHGIWRKSIVFQPTSIGYHLDYFYVKVFEAEKISGKSIVKRGERSTMFPWLQRPYFVSYMRLKGAIAISKSGDLEQQVLLAKPDDHLRMIRTFFALRVWNLL